MDPILATLMAIGGGVSLLTGIMERVQAGQSSEAALQELTGLTAPNLADLKVKFDQGEYVGDLIPNNLGATAQENISLNPEYQRAQDEALAGLVDVSRNKGLDIGAQVRQQQIQDSIGQQNRGAMESIEQNARMRGIVGSPMEMMNKAVAAQGATEARANAGAQLAAQADDQALAALQASGQLGGQIRGQQYGEQANLAAAQDAIAKFNAQNTQGVNERNLNARQDLGNMNVGIRNQQAQQNVNAVQNDYQNRSDLAQSKANARLGYGQQQSANSRQDMSMGGNLISQGGGALYNGRRTTTQPQSYTQSYVG